MNAVSVEQKKDSDKATTTTEAEMNTTNISQEINIDKDGTDKQRREVSTMEKDLNTMESALTVSQRTAICFAAGVIGAGAVVLFSHVLFQLGLSATLGVKAPVSLKSPDIYRPLFWGGLWGILSGLLIDRKSVGLDMVGVL